MPRLRLKHRRFINITLLPPAKGVNQCLPRKSKTKQLDRSYHWTEYEKQHENDDTDRYLGVQRLRKIWCEGTFSHQKARHCMTHDKGKNEGHRPNFGAVLLVRLRGEPKKDDKVD